MRMTKTTMISRRRTMMRCKNNLLVIAFEWTELALDFRVSIVIAWSIGVGG